MQTKVLAVVGTRPEAIKMAPVVRALVQDADNFAVEVCATAQHRELLDSVLRLFRIQPEYDLGVMRPGQTPTDVASEVLARIAPIIRRSTPDWVLVQGDTITVAAASLAAYLAGVRVGHVEAGLRTHDKWNPFPEEIARRIAGVIADLHFAPTLLAQQNLLNEGIEPASIVVTGNTVIDALQWVSRCPLTEAEAAESGLPDWLVDASRADDGQRVILVTAHRRENFGEPLLRICNALREIATRIPRVHVVYPVHPNPSVAGVVQRELEGIKNITLLRPLEYHPFVALMMRATLVLTDSGGVQEEAPGLGKPVLVLREKTERPEAIEAGTAAVVGTRVADIVRATAELLQDQARYDAMAKACNPFGDGRAASRIAEALRNAADAKSCVASESTRERAGLSSNASSAQNS